MSMNEEDIIFCIKALKLFTGESKFKEQLISDLEKSNSVENCLLNKEWYVGYVLELSLLEEKEKNGLTWTTDHEKLLNTVGDIIDKKTMFR